MLKKVHRDKTDTICAVSTPVGEGGIGIIRLSGDEAIGIAGRIFKAKNGNSIEDIPTHTINYGYIINPETEEVIDEVLLSIMKSPKSYTREDMVEINCHGGILPLKRSIELLLKYGAKLAEEGEFTKRAFLNGRIDLTQAEAVIDLIRAKSESSFKLALNQLTGRLFRHIREINDSLVYILANIEADIDFSEDDITTLSKGNTLIDIKRSLKEVERLIDTSEEGRILRDGAVCTIIGRPNVGKSSLLNTLMRKDRAIVTHIPGTTRDTIEEFITIRDIAVKIIDTAGIREAYDPVEEEGVNRTYKAIEEADIILPVIDVSCSLTEEDNILIDRVRDKKKIFILNKIDLPPVIEEKWVNNGDPIVKISALHGSGIERLKDVIYRMISSNIDVSTKESIIITSLKHKEALKDTAASLHSLISSIEKRLPAELLAIDLREAINSLGRITGTTTSEDILDEIFSKFCIGK
ncbi:MAG: tRNA uridine-5-carboxymethylaminomethyl(34) synthesis GTPase MnmE [Nitrospirota bacterium]